MAAMAAFLLESAWIVYHIRLLKLLETDYETMKFRRFEPLRRRVSGDYFSFRNSPNAAIELLCVGIQNSLARLTRNSTPQTADRVCLYISIVGIPNEHE